MPSYNDMESDFDSAKWEIQSTFCDIDNDEIDEQVEKLWQLTRKSDDAQRILMPIIEGINKLNRTTTSCKKILTTLSDIEFDELNVPHIDDDDECDEDGDGE